MQMVANLEALSAEYPSELHVVVSSMGSALAMAEGHGCACYLMKVEGRSEPNATPGGYILLAEREPGTSWTPESVTEQIREALDDARKVRGKKPPSMNQPESPAAASPEAQAGEHHSRESARPASRAEAYRSSWSPTVDLSNSAATLSHPQRLSLRPHLAEHVGHANVERVVADG